MEGRPIFDFPDYDIVPDRRYRLRDDAPTSSLPRLVIVTELPSGSGLVIFRDAQGSTEFKLTTPEFREVFDPA